MASKLPSCAIIKTAARSFGAQAAAQSAAVSSSAPRFDKSRTGAAIVSVDSNEPLSRVGVFLRAGSRYNTVPGLSFVLQHFISGTMSAPQRTGLNMIRTAEQLGAVKNVCVGREVATYAMSSYRDCVDEILSILSTLTSNTNCSIHEYPTAIEIERLKASLRVLPLEKVLDLSFKAAYRNQSMGNSLYVPDYNVNNIDVYQLNDFIKSTHGSEGMVIVGMGMDHDVLYAGAEGLGVQENGGVAATQSQSKYIGGDIRVETGGNTATVVVMGEGAKYATSDSLALKVAEHVLGTGKSVSFGSGANSVLVRALKGTKAAVAGHNFSYSDTGLFGFSVQTDANAAPKTVSSLVSSVKNLSVGEKEVTMAKASVISNLMNSNYGCDELSNIGTQVLLTGSYVPVSDAIKAVESVSPAAVNKAIAKAFSGKLTVASVGNVNDVPYADTL